MKKTNFSIILMAAAITIIIMLLGCQTDKTDTKNININYSNIFSQMFPDQDLSAIDSNSVKNNKNETYYIEQIIYGNYTAQEEQFLVIVRRPPEELSHAAGFYNAYISVFDKRSQKMIIPVKYFSADKGNISLFEGVKRKFLFFAGNVTSNGWTEWKGGLFQAAETGWEKVWPKDERFWDNRAVQIGQDRLILYKREIEKDSLKLVPDYKFILDKEILWDPSKETFIDF